MSIRVQTKESEVFTLVGVDRTNVTELVPPLVRSQNVAGIAAYIAPSRPWGGLRRFGWRRNYGGLAVFPADVNPAHPNLFLWATIWLSRKWLYTLTIVWPVAAVYIATLHEDPAVHIVGVAGLSAGVALLVWVWFFIWARRTIRRSPAIYMLVPYTPESGTSISQEELTILLTHAAWGHVPVKDKQPPATSAQVSPKVAAQVLSTAHHIRALEVFGKTRTSARLHKQLVKWARRQQGPLI